MSLYLSVSLCVSTGSSEDEEAFHRSGGMVWRRNRKRNRPIARE